ncbi:MAG: cysteine synthase A [Clostridia bacterium]
MHYAKSLIDLIGNTPLLKLNMFSENATVLAKCEFFNPLSLKDRPVLHIIEQAEKEGILSKGDTIIESTSGNTGMALAYIAAIKGYKAILCMSEIQSEERKQILRAFGAELILTPASLGTAGAKKRMHEILKDHPEYFYLGQHVNQDNPKAHYFNTGPEIWRDTSGEIDILVAALGTGGTICGAGRYLKEMNKNIELIAVEPEESPYISKGIFKPHKMMGTAPGFVPETLDKEVIDKIELIKTDEAFSMCRKLAEKEGVLVGISSGAVGCALEKIANDPINKGKVIVGVMADTGQRYLSVDGLFKTKEGED